VWLAGKELSVLRRHLELAVRDLDVGAHREIAGLAAGAFDLFGAPHHGADILFALRLRGILVIEHDALRHRRNLVRR
jgi:hypothetical protein